MYHEKNLADWYIRPYIEREGEIFGSGICSSKTAVEEINIPPRPLTPEYALRFPDPSNLKHVLDEHTPLSEDVRNIVLSYGEDPREQYDFLKFFYNENVRPIEGSDNRYDPRDKAMLLDKWSSLTNKMKYLQRIYPELNQA